MVKCLVVDDVELTRMTTEHILKDLGIEAVLTKNTQEAQAAIMKGDVSAVFLDCFIGAEKGLDVLKYIRSTHGNLPVVMFSGVEAANTKSEAMKLGANDFLDKPTTKEKIEGALKRLGLLY